MSAASALRTTEDLPLLTVDDEVARILAQLDGLQSSDEAIMECKAAAMRTIQSVYAVPPRDQNHAQAQPQAMSTSARPASPQPQPRQSESPQQSPPPLPPSPPPPLVGISGDLTLYCAELIAVLEKGQKASETDVLDRIEMEQKLLGPTTPGETSCFQCIEGASCPKAREKVS